MMKEMSNDRRNGGCVWSLVHRTARSTAFKVDYAMIGIICLRMPTLLVFVQDIPVESLDSTAARFYGEIRAKLEETGHLIGNNDLWIGAHAIAFDYRRFPSSLKKQEAATSRPLPQSL
jgi:hypothetical protein